VCAPQDAFTANGAHRAYPETAQILPIATLASAGARRLHVSAYADRIFSFASSRPRPSAKCVLLPALRFCSACRACSLNGLRAQIKVRHPDVVPSLFKAFVSVWFAAFLSRRFAIAPGAAAVDDMWRGQSVTRNVWEILCHPTSACRRGGGGQNRLAGGQVGALAFIRFAGRPICSSTSLLVLLDPCQPSRPGRCCFGLFPRCSRADGLLLLLGNRASGLDRGRVESTGLKPACDPQSRPAPATISMSGSTR